MTVITYYLLALKYGEQLSNCNDITGSLRTLSQWNWIGSSLVYSYLRHLVELLGEIPGRILDNFAGIM